MNGSQTQVTLTSYAARSQYTCRHMCPKYICILGNHFRFAQRYSLEAIFLVLGVFTKYIWRRISYLLL